ncbi:hypothetical protein [Longimicrobium terrae]|uniref:Molybdopterin-binding protein n=1 Tax=Longimicrobium terrae TaxID=1639882 RepID=A0A841GJA5_9BACT|nr:hypothetical protein [Longimicrobium terrae]MBB4634349.1 hypothetical protein [Longimicrobium terrae]MBB6068761.1 hypothetical protein [Longimicrobium terrae]NNC27946.1 hypothetical protein [Longimicrobium terrae]
MLRYLVCAAALVFAAHAPVHAQAADTAAMLELVPLSGAPIRIGAAEWARLPRDTVQAADAGGANHGPIRGAYAGVAVRALLTRMGVPAGPAVRGEVLRFYVVAEASDGYRVIFSVAELDPGISDSSVIVADARDGQPLSAQEGPLRLMSTRDKRPGRWVRNLTRLSVHRTP